MPYHDHMAERDRPTLPPTPDDDRALEYAHQLAQEKSDASPVASGARLEYLAELAAKLGW